MVKKLLIATVIGLIVGWISAPLIHFIISSTVFVVALMAAIVLPVLFRRKQHG